MKQIVCPQCGEHVNVLASVEPITSCVEAADAYHGRRFVITDRGCPIHRCEVTEPEIDLREADEPVSAPGDRALSS